MSRASNYCRIGYIDGLDCSESDGNPAKKPRTSNVLVPQGSSSDRILVDAVADVTATFEEVTVEVFR
jgi:hypothetical protein